MSEEETLEREEPCRISELRRFMFCARSLYWTQRTSNLPTGRQFMPKRRTQEVDMRDLERALGAPWSRMERGVMLGGDRWTGKLDLLLHYEEERVPVLVKVGAVSLRHRADILQLAAFRGLLAKKAGAPITRGVIWYPEQGSIRIEPISAEHHRELERVREAMVTQREGFDFPDSQASPHHCTVCPFLTLCDDDIWITRSSSHDEELAEVFRYEVIVMNGAD